MTSPDQTPKAHITDLGQKARAASVHIAAASTDQKNKALLSAATALRDRMDIILQGNAEDIASVADRKNDAFIDRLKLTPDRIDAMACALEDIAALPDPVGRTLATFDRPNGLKIERVACPIGVIGMIYESRPNVGADASALCLKSGNAIILRGGSESRNSTREIVACMQHGLMTADLSIDVVQTVGTTDREAVAELLKAVDFIDLVIPRGGRGLVELVRDQARVPTLLHLDGNCHSYIHADADLTKAIDIVKNAKLRRTGVCGATESIVIDSIVAAQVVPALADAMVGCELRGDVEACALDARLVPATEEDWGQEYLDAVASVRIADGFDHALEIVATYSSGHTDAIITENMHAAKRFMTVIDSAVVMHNASTQFSDGGEFGMGAEIGIATGKMHARGPVGLEQLTSFKYLVHGNGQTRP
ncbi:MAG: glutamate-5-semialdehyde dehydrogenase [Litorimonas sp.]